MITVKMLYAPLKADPIECDYAPHIAIFSSVLSPLVSNFSISGYTGIIAKNWTTSDDYKEWTFLIREGISFSNGDAITSEIVTKSFKRIIHLIRRRKSKYEFIESIQGIDSFINLSDEIEGLSFDRESISFKFTSPQKNLLDIISLGLFSITNPQNYDQNGNWKNSREAISSGFYEIFNWGNDQIILKLRRDFNFKVGHKSKFENIKFIWTDKKISADIILGSSVNKEDEMSFWGPTKSAIAYVRCTTWNDKNSLLSSKKVRTALKTAFYKSLDRNSINFTRSFFPLAINSVEEFPRLEFENIADIYSHKFLRIGQFASKDKLYNRLLDSIKSSAKILNINIKEFRITNLKELYNTDLDTLKFDITPQGTNIHVDNPYDEIKFMFLSKEGIKLPDLTGEILDEIQHKSEFNVQKVNKLLWEQAVIWPLYHYSHGIWTANDSSIDLSILNPSKASIDFTWVGSND